MGPWAAGRAYSVRSNSSPWSGEAMPGRHTGSTASDVTAVPGAQPRARDRTDPRAAAPTAAGRRRSSARRSCSAACRRGRRSPPTAIATMPREPDLFVDEAPALAPQARRWPPRLRTTPTGRRQRPTKRRPLADGATTQRSDRQPWPMERHRAPMKPPRRRTRHARRIPLDKCGALNTVWGDALVIRVTFHPEIVRSDLSIATHSR